MKYAETLQKGQILSSNPYVCLFDDYVSAQEIEHILIVGDKLLATALVTGANDGVISATRAGRNCWIAHRHDEVIAGVCERVFS